MKKQGTFIIVILDGLELAYQDSCTIVKQTGQIPVLGNEAGFQRYIPDFSNTTISVSGIRATENEAILVNASDNKTIVTLVIQDESTGGLTETYKAFITRLNRAGENEQYATFNAQFRVTENVTAQQL